jgi:hypothetical protein
MLGEKIDVSTPSSFPKHNSFYIYEKMDIE